MLVMVLPVSPSSVGPEMDVELEEEDNGIELEEEEDGDEDNV